MQIRIFAVWRSLFLLGMPDLARAGCGCDHPSPACGQVMPPFGSAGKRVTVFAQAGIFIPGLTYKVEFAGKRLNSVAHAVDRVQFDMPRDIPPDPLEIYVSGLGYDRKYAKSLFTALPEPPRIPARSGVFLKEKWRVAVASDGTLLVPVDVGQVFDPTQFAFKIQNLPLAYTNPDVVIYNADSVDLTLFSLFVDTSRRQWGSYFGWAVFDDTKLRGVVYDGKVKKSEKPDKLSDTFTYWRHEFFTYAAASYGGYQSGSY